MKKTHIQKQQDDIHDNPDWRTLGSFQYNVRAPSGLLRYAIKAAKKFEKMDGTQLDQGTYGLCHRGIWRACLGGATRVIMKDLKTPEQMRDYVFAGTPEQDMGWALGDAREGSIGTMFLEMDLDFHEGEKFNREIPDCDNFTLRTYKALEQLADELEQAGW